VKRVLVVVAVVALFAALVVGIVASRRSGSSLAETVPGTACPSDSRNLIAAQSVPSASLVPCIAALGGRWSLTSEGYTDDGTQLAYMGEDAPDVTWHVDFSASCDTAGATQSGQQQGAAIFRREEQSSSTYSRDQSFVFDGGCVVSSIDVPLRYDRQLILDDIDESLVLVERSALNVEVRDQTDGELQLDP
jgi:hypothetical protein